MAGRFSSGRRGFMAGRIGADDNDDTWDPVGIVRVVELVVVVVLAGASDTLASVNVDWADSGRGGRAFPGDKCARFCAAIASFRAERPEGAADAPLPNPFLLVGVLDPAALACPAFGFPGSLSSKVRDLESRVEMILFR